MCAPVASLPQEPSHVLSQASISSGATAPRDQPPADTGHTLGQVPPLSPFPPTYGSLVVGRS
eukprot:854529-Pyramimonas_sp.AAC.1